MQIVLNADYFKPDNLKFETCVYNSYGKIMYNFYMCVGNARPRRGEVPSLGGNFLSLVFFFF